MTLLQESYNNTPPFQLHVPPIPNPQVFFLIISFHYYLNQSVVLCYYKPTNKFPYLRWPFSDFDRGKKQEKWFRRIRKWWSIALIRWWLTLMVNKLLRLLLMKRVNSNILCYFIKLWCFVCFEFWYLFAYIFSWFSVLTVTCGKWLHFVFFFSFWGN